MHKTRLVKFRIVIYRFVVFTVITATSARKEEQKKYYTMGIIDLRINAIYEILKPKKKINKLRLSFHVHSSF